MGADQTSTANAAVGAAGCIVVIEDDPSIGDLLDLYLRRAQYKVVLATDAVTGLAAIERHDPNLVMLDIGLPGELDGFDVLRELRNDHGARPVMMLTAREDEIDRVLGLELGADDYVVKPFSPREVVARAKAILRRTQPQEAPAAAVIEVNTAVHVDVGRREVRVEGQPVHLATREFDLIHHFAQNLGLALTRQQLLDAVWGTEWYGDERTVDVHIRQLRRKIGDALGLDTVWGVGYRLG